MLVIELFMTPIWGHFAGFEITLLVKVVCLNERLLWLCADMVEKSLCLRNKCYMIDFGSCNFLDDYSQMMLERRLNSSTKQIV